jgi:hypothetical protein
MVVEKNSSYAELVQKIVENYFPHGTSKWQNLHINELTYYVGIYTGEPWKRLGALLFLSSLN